MPAVQAMRSIVGMDSRWASRNPGEREDTPERHRKFRDTRVGSLPRFQGVPSVFRVETSGARRTREGLALRWDEDSTGNGEQPDPGRRIPWQAPRELRGPRIPQDPRTAHPAQDPTDRAPRPLVPEQDPRRANPRPRPAGTAATGQYPVARTRETSSGPTGTARIPVVRPAPAGPAAPRPGVRQPEGPRQAGQPPVRSRLRTPPPASPQQAPGPRAPMRPASLQPPVQQPTPQQLRPFAPSRPAVPPTTTRPFSQLAPAAAPTPPTPIDFSHAPAPTDRRRRPGRGFVAALAVLALAGLWTLPSFASEALDAPPVAGVDTHDLQTYQVASDVSSGGAGADSVSGSLPVAAAPSWIAPVAGHLGDPFGPRPEQPVPGVSLFHRGQDIVAPCGRQIRAAASGTVTTATYWGTYGNWILIDHGDGVAVGYAHESQMLVGVGQHVSVGQVIGLVGQTGAATGCHLHLEVHLQGVAVNPVPFFAAKHISLG